MAVAGCAGVRRLLLAVAAAVAAASLAGGASVRGARSRRGCPCLADVVLAQGAGSVAHADRGERRPRDCTCITGMKTYQTTPRDELLGMGKVALGSHLQSCLRKRDDLQRQSDYEVAAAEARVQEMQGQISAMNTSLGQLKNSTTQNRATMHEERAQLAKEVEALEKDIESAKAAYEAKFKEWYDTKALISKQLSAVSGACKDCATMSEVVVLRQLSAAAAKLPVNDGDRDYMYDTAAKVEDCETSVIALADEIEAAQTRSRQATSEGVAKIEIMKRLAADQQRLSALMSVKPQIEALKNTKAALVDTLESWNSKHDTYKTATDELKQSLEQLDAKLSGCGCLV